MEKNVSGAHGVLCLLHHFFSFLDSASKTKRVRLVFSGVDVRSEHIVNWLSSSKFVRVRIPSLTVDVAKKVLTANDVDISDDEVEKLKFFEGTSMGHLFSLVATAEKGKLQIDPAYEHFRHDLLSRRKAVITPEIVYRMMLLLSQGKHDKEKQTVSFTDDLSAFEFLKPDDLGHTAWLRIIDEHPLRIEAPSSWHYKAFTQRMKEGSSIISTLFFTSLAALATDPSKQKGFILQLLFVVELFLNMSSPLWNAIGAEALTFKSVIRFSENPSAWEKNKMYLVAESFREKLGDIVFYDARGQLFALELKCSSDNSYLNAGFGSFAATADDANNAKVQCRYVVTADKFVPTCVVPNNLKVVANPVALPSLGVDLKAATESMDLPTMIESVLRDIPSQAHKYVVARVVSGIGVSVGAEAGIKRTRDDATKQGVWVQEDAPNSVPFCVLPRDDNIAFLKKAIAPDFNPRQQAQITIIDPKGNEVTNLEQDARDQAERSTG